MAKSTKSGNSGRAEWAKYVINGICLIVGFGIGQWDHLLDLFIGTTIAVTVPAGLDPAGMNVQIESAIKESSQTETTLPIGTAEAGIAVTPGLYKINLVRNDLLLSSRFAEVDRGKHVTLTFTDKDLEDEWRRKQKIDVKCDTDRASYRPSESIAVQIAATGVGYLWIEEIDEQGNVTGSYPPPEQDVSAESQNIIGPARAMNFPMVGGQGFIAEQSAGKYRLICLVTSSPDRAEADAIFHQIIGVKSKGYGTLATNWGYEQADYAVAPMNSQ